MKNAAQRVASFYWQFTGVLNQDVPLDDEGQPTEFARYVRYFVERKKHFQGELADPLQRMMVATYLDALEAGSETRAAIRKASYAAHRISRRSKPLAGIELGTVPREGSVDGFVASGWMVRDVVEATLLDHGLPLLQHILSGFSAGDVAKRRVVCRPSREMGAAMDAAGHANLDRWIAALGLYIAASERGGDEASRALQELRNSGACLVRSDPGPRRVSRFRDRAEAVSDAIAAWAGLAKKAPVRAALELIREIRASPRLVPSAAFLIANTALFVWIVTGALAEIETGWGVLALVASVVVSLWVTDAFTYAVHLERDGWGDSTVARAFQDHHDVPDEVGLWTVRRSVGTTGMMILIPMTVLAFAQPHFMLAAGAAVFLMGILFATQTHRWAHAPPDHIPRWVAALQKVHLMIPNEAHAVHHDNLDRSWGIFNGWSNGLLDHLGYHEKYTRLRARLFGDIRPLWESQLEARAASARADMAPVPKGVAETVV